jgi:hypothetical protein
MVSTTRSVNQFGGSGQGTSRGGGLMDVLSYRYRGSAAATTKKWRRRFNGTLKVF